MQQKCSKIVQFCKFIYKYINYSRYYLFQAREAAGVFPLQEKGNIGKKLYSFNKLYIQKI